MIPLIHTYRVCDMIEGKMEGLSTQIFNLQKQLAICDTEVLLNKLISSNDTLKLFADLSYFKTNEKKINGKK